MNLLGRSHPFRWCPNSMLWCSPFSLAFHNTFLCKVFLFNDWNRNLTAKSFYYWIRNLTALHSVGIPGILPVSLSHNLLIAHPVCPSVDHADCCALGARTCLFVERVVSPSLCKRIISTCCLLAVRLWMSLCTCDKASALSPVVIFYDWYQFYWWGEYTQQSWQTVCLLSTVYEPSSNISSPDLVAQYWGLSPLERLQSFSSNMACCDFLWLLFVDFLLHVGFSQ